MDPINTFTDYGEELFFMPTIVFGYMYTIEGKIDLFYFPQEVPYTNFGFHESTVLLFMTTISLLSSSFLYLTAVDDDLFDVVGDMGLIMRNIYATFILWGLISVFIMSPLASLLEINHGDIILNTLVLIQLTFLVIWGHITILDRYTPYDGDLELSEL